MFFQNTIIKKYTALLNEEQVSAAWNTYKAYFLNPAIQENIRASKEEQFQEGFFRELFYGSNPEYQIMNWDCGWYQIKALAKEYGKNQLDEFNVYKALADKMRPMVYTLGFLK